MSDETINPGRNTISGQQLQSFVDRLERLNADKKSVSDDITALKAEAKSAGFLPKAIVHVVKVRAMKPHDRQENEAIIDLYMHSLGMVPDVPLFRAIQNMDVDIMSRSSVTEALKKLVPQDGSIIIEMGGKPVRLTRDSTGDVHESDVVDTATQPPAMAARAAKAAAPPADVPNVTAEAAEALGAEAYKANTPIIANPFPFGDERRPRWDKGWREASGSTGMGEDDDDRDDKED